MTGGFFRHTFGIEGVAGRNVNMAIISRGALCDVANFIVMEADGQPWAVETAFGINNIVTRVHELAHPVLATTAAGLPTLNDGRDLMRMDALSSAVALAIEGFLPRARGREGNYRTFVRELVPLHMSDPEALRRVVLAAALRETRIRNSISPLREGLEELAGEEAAKRLVGHIERVAGAGHDRSSP